MEPLLYIDRATGTVKTEKVYGAKALYLLYGSGWMSRVIGAPLLHFIVKNALFSALYGYWQNTQFTRNKIAPFIQAFDLDPAEFSLSSETFTSFNEFFIRQLKPEARPIATGKHVAVMPADARYRFYPNISESEGFLVKGEKFDLPAFLEDTALADRYKQGTMILVRLCPSDYHRYHFPVDCIPGPTRLINGWLYSVNPLALKRDIHIFTRNKRTVCELETESFGKVLFCEVGATNVGSIHQTYQPGQFYPKGAEKGYFSFGASSLVLLFEPGRIHLDADLLAYAKGAYEVRCLMGQSLGSSRTKG